MKQRLTLKERGKAPPSFYLTVLLTFLLQYLSGVFSYSSLSILQNDFNSSIKILSHIRSSPRIKQEWKESEGFAGKDRIISVITLLLVGNIIFILVWSPFRAGMWTGKRAKRFQMHRYGGLCFLCLYGLAWVEFISNYHSGDYGSTLLPHLVAFNGLVQAQSAYFSFKVLPESKDPGYYSDKAVLSRTFVHENVFYQLMSLAGSLYYQDHFRSNLQSTSAGRIVEIVYVFFPYILIRSWFPRTSFNNAGTTRAGRSKKNEQFYQIGTTMIKIFYLWAKYFLGFYVNFLFHLNKVNDEDSKYIQGLFLLNVGTVSISVFLHTLRFKKVLPPKVTFSFYLVQIYLTFLAIPFFFRLYMRHKALGLLVLVGLVGNLTRSSRVHTVWCGLVTYLLLFTEIDW